jgi:hypothetical protein
MMKTHRTTYTLLTLFTLSLVVLWGLEYAGVRTGTERRLRESLLLPELLETPQASIRKLAVERGKDRVVFERRGSGLNRWQMIEPVNVAAEPSRLETLVHNLKDLRHSLDAGSMTGSPATYGLDHPDAIVQLWGDDESGSAKRGEPLATLAVGKTVRGVRYVRAGQNGSIEIADAKLLTALDQAPAEWRERVVMGTATFQISSIAIKRPTGVIRADRGRAGRWRLVEPVVAPADGAKVESLLAALSSLRVTDGASGFAADDVRDFSPYGLSPPAATVELTATGDARHPLVLEIGKAVPGRPDRVYVRQGDQDDVITVDAKPLADLPQTSLALRSKRIADFNPAAVSEIRLKTQTMTFRLEKESNVWMLKAPHEEKADPVTVLSLLKEIGSMETSEFFEPGKVRDPQVSPPLMTIQIREQGLFRKDSVRDSNELVLDLRLGRYDAARKVFFAQLENDQVILALADTLLKVLPKNAMAFRERALNSSNPAGAKKLIITRAGRTDELVPEQTGEPNRWRMRRPIDGPADARSITQILAILANLRAEDYVADSQQDAAKFGLENPLLEVEWETDRMHRLTVGAQVPRTPSYYAAMDDQPFVFTLKAETLKPFEAEFREHRVLSFPLEKAVRLVLTWARPKHSITLKRHPVTAKGELEWIDEPGSDSRGIDLSSVNALATALSHLETVRFSQYEGEIPAYTGLLRPRLTVAVNLGATEPDRIIRVGHPAAEGVIYAAEGRALSGPVFLLPAGAWDSLIKSGERLNPLPRNVFAPAPG